MERQQYKLIPIVPPVSDRPTEKLDGGKVFLRKRPSVASELSRHDKAKQYLVTLMQPK